MSISPVRPDVIQRPRPDHVRLKGLVGQRFEVSRLNRLRHQEEDHLLWPFREHCPVGYEVPNRPHQEIHGDWQGEFIGTWLNAAVLSAWNANDEALRQKITTMVDAWLATQQPDGYLGTYDEPDRWKSWDLWVQAHDLIGLLSVYWYTNDQRVLEAAVRVANRVLEDFGPGKRHVFPTGPHGGMASSAILEPLMWLYWETGDTRYLEWGRWLADVDWEAPGGPALIRSLSSGRGVAGTANGKAIEMLICFAGLVELYRATGDRRYLEPVLIAWEDIVEHHLYITGSASTGEYFMKDYALRNDGVYHIGETCVSMGWLYLNLSLGRLLGEGRFFDMAEQTLYNHLLAAQSPDGRGWAYYVGLRDHKRYRWHTDPECCPSRGVRALAQMPQHVWGIAGDALVVNFYEAAEGKIILRNGTPVHVQASGEYPFDGNVRLQLGLDQPAQFIIRLRVPGWCKEWTLQVNNREVDAEANAQGYLAVEREWRDGDMLELHFEMPVRAVADRLGNVGKIAFVRGPLVFAADTSYLPTGRLLEDIVVQLERPDPQQRVRVVWDTESRAVHLRVPTAVYRPLVEAGWWREKERYDCIGSGDRTEATEEIELVPFFEAGNRESDTYRDGIWQHVEPVRKFTYQVWLPYRWV